MKKKLLGAAVILFFNTPPSSAGKEGLALEGQDKPILKTTKKAVTFKEEGQKPPHACPPLESFPFRHPLGFWFLWAVYGYKK